MWSACRGQHHFEIIGYMASRMPSYADMLWPTLQAVIELGGAASNDEIEAAVIARCNYSPEVQGILHLDLGLTTEIQYRLAWARTYLKAMGLLKHHGRTRSRVWSVTPRGRMVTEEDVRRLHASHLAGIRQRAKQRSRVSGGATGAIARAT